MQEAVLTSGQWHLQAFIRTDGLTTDQGISLRIYDPLQPQRLDIRTDALTGTHEWMKVERVLVVEAQTALVQVEVMRQASLKIDNKISGKAWIDAVELRPIVRSSPHPSRVPLKKAERGRPKPSTTQARWV